MLRTFSLALFTAGLLRAAAPAGVLTAQVSSITVPAGGTAQIRVSLVIPKALVSGEVVMDLDATVFGDIVAADVFSATGDQIGTVTIQGRHLDAQFASATGGIGRLPGVPILTVAVPVLTSAPSGTLWQVSFNSGPAPWKDVQGVQYSINPIPGTLTIGGSLSIEDVVPGGGLAAAGTVVRIDGTGFTPTTALEIDGVSVASTQFVSPQEFDFTLGAAADLTGKRILLTNPGGASVDFFSSLRGTFVSRPTSGPLVNVQPIFPLQTYAAADAGNFLFSQAAVALENQTSQPVDVILKNVSVFENGAFVTDTNVTLPPGGIYVQTGSDLAGGTERSHLQVVPAVPIRMAVVDPTAGAFLIAPTSVPVTQVAVAVQDYFNQLSDANPLSLDWQIGTAPPTATLTVFLQDVATPFTVSASTASGVNWLSVSPGQGTTCNTELINGCPASSQFTVTVNPSKLAPGVYRGTITVTPGGFNPKPTMVPVILNASTLPTISASTTFVGFFTASLSVAPGPVTLNVTSNGASAAFSLNASTQSGRNWLSVTPAHGSTPATLTATADPKQLPGISDNGTITIAGPRNTLTISVSFGTTPPPPVLTPAPAALQFFAQAGQPAPPAQFIEVPPVFDPFTISFQTPAGATWLQPTIHESPGVPYINVVADPTGLAPGKYQGSIVIQSAAAAGPATVPVTLTVWTGAPPAVMLTPTGLSFTAAAGTAAPPQTLNVSTGNLQLYYSVAISTIDGNNWLAAYPQTLPTPVGMSVSADATNLTPGSYHGTITITAPAGSTNSATVPVTFTVTAAPPAPPPLPQAGPPLAVAIVSAASQNAGAITPGEIFTVFGQNIGPPTPVGFTLDTNGKVATNLNGARVLLNGVPAPLIYASATQVNAIAPYEIAGQTSVTLAVELNGTLVNAAGVPVGRASPAIFSLDGTGVGRAAVLNQDNSINDPANPAARGSVIQIYATGEGITSPAGTTGEVTGSDTKKPILPVTLMIGDAGAVITYAASAPNAVAGLFQINAVVPQSAAPGPAVPILLTVGIAQSQAGVTIAVK